MVKFLEDFFIAMRPAFSRKAAYSWFVVVFVGFIMRNDTFGVTSIVRALSLPASSYPCLLHFFHSSAWTGDVFLQCWRQWLTKQKAFYPVGERLVFIGDHTKAPKDGRKIPQVTTLHQNSETSSKPSFFRGHHWACIGLLYEAKTKFFSIPLWAEIHHDGLSETLTTRIVAKAGDIASSMKSPALLVLDAFFAVGPVFQTAAKFSGNLHVLTRAKKNAVAYQDAPKIRKAKRGRPRKYGKKLRLIELFDKWADKFETEKTTVYGNAQSIRSLTLDLIWKPIKRKMRFILLETSHGRIILMTSDFSMSAKQACELYCHRVTIETVFYMLKNILGGMEYHFWSQYLTPSSRRPTKNKKEKQKTSKPEKTQNTFDAIQKFLLVQLVVLGTIQLISALFSKQIFAEANCWLRTPCGEIPSVFITRNAIRNILQKNILNLAKNQITRLILEKKNKHENTASKQNAA
jgi:hypothetical protein